MNTVYVDMDGVLTNFVDHALAVHGTSAAALDAKWPAGKYNVHEVMGLTEDEFWAKINQRFAFWDSLPLYPWADEIWALASTLGKAVVLSAPSMDQHSASGKIACLQRWMGRHFRDWVLTPAKHKHLLAAPGRLLIDDADRNVADFRAAGGTAILFPRRWNENHAHAADPVRFVVQEIARITK